MYLYHYSKAAHSSLRTNRHRGIETPEKDESYAKYRPGEYDDHISFFFEKPPLEILGSIYGPDHHTWAPGATLYEHTVDVASLGKFKFELVESPEVVALFYDSRYDDYQGDRWAKLVYDTINRHGYIGSTEEELAQAVKRNKGLVEKMYRLVPSRSDYEKLKTMYAATVPHLMVYPETGEVDVYKTQKVKVGNQPYQKKGVSPVYAKW